MKMKEIRTERGMCILGTPMDPPMLCGFGMTRNRRLVDKNKILKINRMVDLYLNVTKLFY